MAKVHLDGSHLEGGGQIVRTGLALSTLLLKSFSVDNIRAGRPTPGLKAQHLHATKALKELCNAHTENADLGATEITYVPGRLKGRTLSIDIGTAGSITLLLQALLLPCVFSGQKFKLKITGGTDVAWSPSFDYFTEIILPQLRKYADIECSLQRRGYYPKGSGQVELVVKSKFSMETISNAPQVDIQEQGTLMQIKGVAHASTALEAQQVAERMSRAARLTLTKKLSCPIDIRTEYVNTLSEGCGITLWAIYSKDPNDIDFMNPIRLGADGLGQKGKRSETVGVECAEQLIEDMESGAAVDRHLADMLVPMMGLLGGSIKTSKITNHTKTNVYTTELLTGKKIKIEGSTLSLI